MREIIRKREGQDMLMQFTKNLKLISVPLFVGACVFIFTFFLFVGVYVLFEYRGYLSFYETAQQSELKSIQQKTETAFNTMDDLLGLTSARIAASKNDLKRIHNILVSTPQLVPLDKLPPLLSVTYYIVSKPYKRISRIGIASLEYIPPDLSDFKNKETLVFQDDVVNSKILVFDERENLKGILEIKIMSSDFTAFLSEMKTLSLIPFSSSPDQISQPLQKKPFELYGRPPDSFWQFVHDHQDRYAIFCCYTLVVFLLFLMCVGYFYLYFQKKYGNTITNSTEEIAELKEKLGLSEQKYKNCWASFQAYKKIHANLNNEKREQALHICKALAIVTEGVKGTKLHYSTAQQFEFLQSSLKLARFLSEGTMTQRREEKIDINHLLGDVSALFAEKIYKSNVILDITCPDDLFFYGDPLFTELLLVNVLGKAIYRLAKNGKASIAIMDQGETIFFELKDKGFPSDGVSEKAFKKSFDLFIPENSLKKMCHENDLQYISLRGEKNFNITKIIIPKVPVKNIGDNVIKLFQ